MPRGKYVNHKGRNRHFTDVEELEEERKKAEQKKWRKKQDGEESSEEEEEASEKSEGSESEEESGSEDDTAAKGVHALIEIENPNRVQKKAATKVTQVSLDGPSGSKPELSRREREELEKQRAQANYQKLHAQGKTEQARADLARLAIIKQHRAEAAARREAEKKEKEEKKKATQR
uniref:CSON007093 protein n=1 Tax=Culicoides sonorensis TaxID=179676 RepID=A0A336MXS6_CULSO